MPFEVRKATLNYGKTAEAHVDLLWSMTVIHVKARLKHMQTLADACKAVRLGLSETEVHLLCQRHNVFGPVPNTTAALKSGRIHNSKLRWCWKCSMTKLLT